MISDIHLSHWKLSPLIKYNSAKKNDKKDKNCQTWPPATPCTMVGSQSVMWKRLFIVPEACSRYHFEETGKICHIILFFWKPCPDLRQRQEPWFPPPAGHPCCLSGARLSHLLLQGSEMSGIFSYICLLPILNLWCQSSVGGGEDDDCVVKDTSLFPFLLVRHPVINKSLSTLG